MSARDMDCLDLLTVSELKRQLVTAGLPVSGRKADLVQRLLDARQGEGKVYIKSCSDFNPFVCACVCVCALKYTQHMQYTYIT